MFFLEPKTLVRKNVLISVTSLFYLCLKVKLTRKKKIPRYRFLRAHFRLEFPMGQMNYLKCEQISQKFYIMLFSDAYVVSDMQIHPICKSDEFADRIQHIYFSDFEFQPILKKLFLRSILLGSEHKFSNEFIFKSGA